MLLAKCKVRRVAFTLLITAGLVGCDKDDAPETAAEATGPAVIFAQVVERDVVQSQRFVGRVEAVDRVDLSARVEGFLEARFAEDGASIAAGDPLFRIEPGPYQVAVVQAEASVSEATAALQLAQVDLVRKAELLER